LLARYIALGLVNPPCPVLARLTLSYPTARVLVASPPRATETTPFYTSAANSHRLGAILYNEIF